MNLDPNITNDDLLVLADLLSVIAEDHKHNGPTVIDERSEGECARVLDGSLEADLRASYVSNDQDAQADARAEEVQAGAERARARAARPFDLYGDKS